MQRDLTNLYVSESYYRLLQTDPTDDRTLLDGTGSLVTYLAVSGTVDAYYFKGDGSQITNISPATLPSGVVSSSAQTLKNLSGTNIVSSSAQRSVLGLATTDSPTFNNLILTGDLTARQLIISSSVISVTQSFSSGSNIFGNSLDDTHQFTGSVYITGSVYGTFVGNGAGLTNIVALGTLSSSQQIQNFGFITSSDWNELVNKPSGIVSSSVQVLGGTGIISSSTQRSSIGLGTSDNVTFGNISGSGLTLLGNAYIDGTLTARTYVISSSIVNIQSIRASGSTQFGDTIDDTHQFTGSLFLSGSLTSRGTITAPLFSGSFDGAISSSQQISNFGFVTSGELSGSVYWNNILNKPSGLVSSSTQTLTHLFGTNIVSGSGQRSVLGLGESDSPRFATLYATNANYDGNVVVGGTLTARTYVISSSVVNYEVQSVSGSTKFGDTADDIHQFTGSLFVSRFIQAPSFTGSLQGTASYSTFAISSSYATNSSTASYSLQSLSSSFATTASYVLNAVSSSFATNSSTASFVLQAVSSSFATNSSTASFVLQAVSSSFATNSSTASFLSGTVTSASFATTASYVLNSVSSSFATNSSTASYVLNSVSSSFATNSSTASFLSGTVTSASFASTASFLSGTVTSASFAVTASYATSASYLIGGAASSNVKGGYVSFGSFTGAPKIATVTFGSAFSDNNYTVTVTGEDVRVWSVESKTAAGFTINTNSNVALTNSVYWIATTFSS
jgi:hypothetical protein